MFWRGVNRGEIAVACPRSRERGQVRMRATGRFEKKLYSGRRTTPGAPGAAGGGVTPSKAGVEGDRMRDPKEAWVPALLIRHTVTDYERWKPAFDEQAGTRRAYGSGRERVFRNAAAPDEVVVLCEWDDLDRARFFLQSEDLHDALARADLTDRPDVWLLNEGSQPANA